MTAAYMRILIHTMNNSLFQARTSTTWIGPPAKIVIVQSLLYASLTASLSAAFLAMFGKKWVNRYIGNHGGSVSEKSRDRQRKLDGFEKWHVRFVIESFPVMLQVGSLLLGCALSLHLWTISHTVAGVIIAMVLFGVTAYFFLFLAATFCYDCPYQSSQTILARAAIKYLTYSDVTFVRSLLSLIACLPSVKSLGRLPGRIRSGVRSALESFCCVPAAPTEAEHIPLVVAETPTRIFEDISIDWEVCKTDVRCICWMLDSTTDPEVILSTVRFAVDMIWYPEIAGGWTSNSWQVGACKFDWDGTGICAKCPSQHRARESGTR